MGTTRKVEDNVGIGAEKQCVFRQKCKLWEGTSPSPSKVLTKFYSFEIAFSVWCSVSGSSVRTVETLSE